jgi:hypothetical protein
MAESDDPGLVVLSIRFRGRGISRGEGQYSYYEEKIVEELARLGAGQLDGGGIWPDGSFDIDVAVDVFQSEQVLHAIYNLLRGLGAPAETHIFIDDWGEFRVYGEPDN